MAMTSDIDMDVDVPDDASDDFANFDSDSDEPSPARPVLTKERDAEELELERAVFGDADAWLDGLKSAAGTDLLAPRQDTAVALDEEEDEELSHVKDDDLFFLDAGPTPTIQHELAKRVDDDEDDEDERAAWIDSDDDRLVVSLASNPRLRKLRVTEDEDLVDGREYIRRLRVQYERLHPRPVWAQRKPQGDESSAGESFDSEEETDEALSTRPLARLLQDTSLLVDQGVRRKGSGRLKLRPDVIEMQRLKDVGHAQPGVITAMAFHPTYPILLTAAGQAGLLSLFHISSPFTSSSSTPNPLITNLHVPSTSLSTVLFSADADKILFSGARRRFYHAWNLSSGRVEKVSSPLMLGPGGTSNALQPTQTAFSKPSSNNKPARAKINRHVMIPLERFKPSPCGRYIGIVNTLTRRTGGEISIIDAHTCHWLADARVEGRGGIADFAWWSNGEGMVVVGKGGEAIEYSMPQRRVTARWIEHGGVGITVVALSHASHQQSPALGPDRYIAIGSTSGIVTIYNRLSFPQSSTNDTIFRPTPLKTLPQLTTPISALAFSPDNQILALSSRWKRDAVRLVHIPSGGTVYKNWPSSGTPLGRVSAIAWNASPTASADGDMVLAVGNEQGRVRLYAVTG